MAKKIKKSNLLFLIALGLFLILIVKLIFFFTAKPNISVNYVAEWNKLTKPADYAPNKNAFFDYKRAADLFTEMPEEMSDYDRPFPDWPGDMSETQLNTLRSWLDENKEALEYFEQGSKKSYYWYKAPEDKEMWDILFPDFYIFRYCTRAVIWRAKLLAFENRTDEALEDLLTCYRAANQISDKKSVIEQLVGMSLKGAGIDSCFEILANSKIDTQTLANFENKLRIEVNRGTNKLDITGDRYFMYNIVQHIFTDNGKGNGHLIPREYRRLWHGSIVRLSSGSSRSRDSFLYRISDWDSVKNELSDIFGDFARHSSLYWYALTGPDRKRTIQILDKMFDRYQDLQSQTPWQLNKKGIDAEKELESILEDIWVVAEFPVIYRYVEIFQRIKTVQSALLTVIATMRYKAEKGFYPESLSELVDTSYLSELPMDPFNDGPLTYMKIGDNFTLYSFGPDFDDDGGEIERAYDGRIRWWDDEGDTVFWPRPKETEEEKQKRLEEQNMGLEQRVNEMIIRLRSDEEVNDFNDAIIDSNNEI